MRELDLLLNAALKAGATDLHVSERIAPRMRVDKSELSQIL